MANGLDITAAVSEHKYYTDYLWEGNQNISKALMRVDSRDSFEQARQRLAQGEPQVGPNGQVMDFDNPVIVGTVQAIDTVVTVTRVAAGIINGTVIAVPITGLMAAERVVMNFWGLVFCDEQGE